MSEKKRLFLTSFAGIVGTIALGVALLAPSIYGGGYHVRQPLINDWSHHHMVFSPPSGLVQTWKVQQQARYQMQWARLHSNRGTQAQTASSWGNLLRRQFEFRKTRLLRQEPVTRDWAVSFNALTGIGSVGRGMYPAKYTFDVTATPDCTNDYVAINTSLPGSASTPNVLAYNQLYQGTSGYCGTGAPNLNWSYDTGTGVAATSIVLSFAGDKIAFIEQPGTINGSGNLVASGTAVLRIVEWHAGDGTLTSPATPGSSSNGNWTGCTAGASCMISVTFANGDSDTRSSVYYDYPSDALYVGDDLGNMHKFTGVFLGTPAEVTTSWPISVGAGAALATPVYDEGSGNIFVGDAAGNFSYIREVGSTAGTCSAGSPPCFGATQALGNTSRAIVAGTLGATTPDGIVDAPLVDSTLGDVYVFDGHTCVGTNCASPGPNAAWGAVFEFNTALTQITETSFGANESITTTGASSDIFAGTFDNNYFTSVGGTGYLYTCGKLNSISDRPTLGQIPITAGVMLGTQISAGIQLTSAGTEECSPVTEVFNTATSTDWLFFSVGNQAVQTGAGCTAATSPGTASGPGCIMSLNLEIGCGGVACTNLTWPPASDTVTAGFPTGPGATWSHFDATSNSGGTSGIIIDNVADTSLFPQASSLYFTWIAAGSTSAPNASCGGNTSGGCAVKLTQSGFN